MGRIHLGSILGTSITLDFSFIILIAFFVLTDIDNAGMPRALLWAPVLFISVLVHELAHAATIGVFGYGASAIVLGGIGGATFNRRQARPWQDMLISAAGPLSSFALAFALTLLPPLRDRFFQELLPLLLLANVWWGIFNLLPVGPLDGAGIVRNFLRLFLNERTAFMISVWISIVVGTAVALLGLAWRQVFLAILMAWYVWSSWSQWQFFRSTNRTDD